MIREILKHINRKMAEKEGFVSEQDYVPYEKVKDLITNPETFAQKIEAFEKEIYPEVKIKGETIELGGGHFTNKYTLSFPAESDKYNSRIVTRNSPLFMHRYLINDDSVVAAINGPFFCLHDGDLKRYPKEIIYHTNIRDGLVFGLPSADRPMLYVDESGEMKCKDAKAVGSIQVGNTVINWIGGEGVAHGRETAKDNEVYLFNSACCTIEYQDRNDKTSLRMLNEEKNFTPANPNKTDLVVDIDEQNRKLIVSKIKEGGGVDFFEGLFILQVPNEIAKSLNIGDFVSPIDIDGIALNSVLSAVSTGPLVHHFIENDDHPINHDPSLGTFPPFEKGKRYARSVVYKQNGLIHFTVFDGVPRSRFMLGATPKEVAENIPENSDWAVFLDGGQSSRITFREQNGQIDAFGNKQYLRLHVADKTAQVAKDETRFLWTKRGRPVNSVIELVVKK